MKSIIKDEEEEEKKQELYINKEVKKLLKEGNLKHV